MDDHGVDIGNIESCLNDRRRHKHVDLSIDKLVHDIFQFGLFHLSMRIGDIRLRHKLCDLRCHIRDLFHAIVYIIRLSATRQLSGYCLPHKLLIIFHHISLDRDPIHRRFFQHTHVADSDQTHMQCSWDWCRG